MDTSTTIKRHAFNTRLFVFHLGSLFPPFCPPTSGPLPSPFPKNENLRFLQRGERHLAIVRSPDIEETRRNVASLYRYLFEDKRGTKGEYEGRSRKFHYWETRVHNFRSCQKPCKIGGIKFAKVAELFEIFGERDRGPNNGENSGIFVNSLTK